MTIKKGGGFTLIEVMVALSTLAVALLAGMGLYLSSIRADTRNRDQSRALFLANQTVEEIRSIGFEAPGCNCDNMQGDNCENLQGCECEHIDGHFDRYWCFTQPQAWRKNIVVTVTWWETVKDLKGVPYKKQRSVQVATVIVQLD